MPTTLVSWNVNGIRACVKKGFLTYLQETEPDVLLLQETKAHPDVLDDTILNPIGYHTAWEGAEKKGYSGTALFSKTNPITVIKGFGNPKFDCEARVMSAIYPDFTVLGVYFPNGQKDDERLQYKLEFYDHFFAYCRDLRAQGQSLVIMGDYNTAHTEIDLANPKENSGISGFLPVERAWMDRIVAEGYIDTFREFNQEPEQYTWWTYRAAARRRNIGWRIDYVFITPDLRPRLTDAFIQSDVLGSDHCPVGITLA